MTRPTKPRASRPPTRTRQTVKNALRESANYVEPAPGSDDPTPADIDVFRLALTRRIMTFLGLPRRCRDPICRRSKLCKGANMRCARDVPAPQLTPEQEAQVQAEMHRMVRLRMAELGRA